MDKVCRRDSYFVQKRNVCRWVDLSSYQKIISALRMFALGVYADAMDDYCRTSESIVIECMK